MFRRTLLAAVAMTAFSAPIALAGNPSGPCTTEPKDKWMPIEDIEAFVVKHGYTVLNSKIKNSCVEMYVQDAKGQKVEYFFDPATGFVVEADMKKGPLSQ
jgi:hypothetical protein